MTTRAGKSLSAPRHDRQWHAIVRFGVIVRALLCTLLAFSSAVAQTGKPFRVAVVKSLDLPEYNEAYEGFIAAVVDRGLAVEATPYTMGRSAEEVEETIQTIRQSQTDLILALGTRAAREISQRESTIPIVYAMVLAMQNDSGERSFLQTHANVTGATLNIPIATQLDEIRHVFPTARTIGIISDPSHTRSMTESAREMAAAQGLELRVAWAESEPEIPGALRQLRDSIDVLWMLPDETVLTPRSSRFIIFELIKAGVPVVGLSAAYVKAGALMALDCDYDDIGRQSGELAADILQGQAPASVPHTAPRAFTRAINLKIREHMKIAVDDAIIQDSNVVVY